MPKGNFLVLALAAAAFLAAGPAAAGDPEAGEKVFKKHLCFSCHSLKEGQHRIGPSLYNIMGREAGTVEGFKNYSDGLKESGIVWNEETLKEWVANPKGMVKDTKMLLAKPVKDEQAADDLIAYLKEASE